MEKDDEESVKKAIFYLRAAYGNIATMVQDKTIAQIKDRYDFRKKYVVLHGEEIVEELVRIGIRRLAEKMTLHVDLLDKYAKNSAAVLFGEDVSKEAARRIKASIR